MRPPPRWPGPTPRGASRGATLIELLVGTAIFGFLMLASVAMLQIGMNGWRAIEARSSVARQLNLLEADMIQELKRAFQSTVGVYTPGSDYRWALWMKTNVNSPGCVDAGGSPLRLGDSLVPVTNQGAPVPQRYIVYYVTRMDPDEHQAQFGYLCSSFSTTTGPDTVCPHKLLVKKDIYLLTGKTTGSDSIGPPGGGAATIANLVGYTHDLSCRQSALLRTGEAFSPASNVSRTRIVARNVVSFEVTRLALDPANPLLPPRVDARGPIVLFDIKTFKSEDAGASLTVGQQAAAAVSVTADAGAPGGQMVQVQGAGDSLRTSSTVTQSFGAFTVQVDNRVIPQNP